MSAAQSWNRKPRQGSAGKGKWHGGNGATRRVRFLEPMTAAILSGHRTVRPHGMAMYAPATANRLAAIWGDTASAGDAMEDLLTAAETALPHAIAVELLRLYEYHARCLSPQGRPEVAR